MRKAGYKSPHLGGVFNTLVNSATNHHSDIGSKEIVYVNGKGIDRSKKSMMKKWAKKKLISLKIVFGLINVANQRGCPERAKKYRNAYYCQKELIVKNGKIHTKLCGTRYCEVCLGNRKAKLINAYQPILKEWGQLYFVTLTLTAVKGHELKNRFVEINKTIRKIIRKHKKRHERGKGPKMMGIKSMECNFNPIKQTYNPHFHLIVNSLETATTLAREWKNHFGEQVNYWKGIRIRKVKDLEKDLIETIKYGCKFMTDPTMAKRGKSKVSPMIYIASLDTIYSSLPRRGVFERFGFQAPKTNAPKKIKNTLIYKPQKFHFDDKFGDWVDEISGELLTGNIVDASLEYILENNIDMEKS